jgi:23S rRNA (cytidine2498-2'-O)-methyltransferase
LPFVHAVTRTGCEALLKREAARVLPGLRLAFSRPGFVTFKADDDPAVDWTAPSAMPLVFARVRGLCLGRAGSAALPGPDPVRAVLEAAAAHAGDSPLRLHAFARDGDDPRDDARPLDPEAEAAGQALRAAAPPGLFHDDPVAARGDLVLDLVVTGPGERWVGLHRQGADRLPHPGARPPLVLPPEAPSRAWLKLQEALLWTGFPVQPGDCAVEVGSAPGGASFALLQRGADVWGVDPTAMDPRVLDFPGPARFTHVRKPVAQVRDADLPPAVHWLLADVNEGPERVLAPVERLVRGLGGTLLGLLLTVKANRPEVADGLPLLMDRARALGLVDVRLAHLSFHHRELLLSGRTTTRWKDRQR